LIHVDVVSEEVFVGVVALISDPVVVICSVDKVLEEK
jgi:hypothetical protein